MSRMKDFVLPTNDYAFKSMFADEKNIECLLNFTCAVLKIKEKQVKSIAVKNPDLPKDVNSEQDIKLDLIVEIFVKNEVKVINIEMQCIVYDSFADRTLLYWAKLHGSQDSVKAHYSELKQTIGIYLVKEKMFDIDKFHLKFSLLEESSFIKFSDNLEMHVLQLPVSLTKEDKNLINWIKFFNIKEEADIDNIEKEGGVMEKICEALKHFNYDEQAKYMALSREKAITEKAALYHDGEKRGREEGRKEGRKEGKEEGRKEGKMEMAKEMLLEKIDIKLISKISKLSIEEIEKIKKEL